MFIYVPQVLFVVEFTSPTGLVLGLRILWLSNSCILLGRLFAFATLAFQLI